MTEKDILLNKLNSLLNIINNLDCDYYNDSIDDLHDEVVSFIDMINEDDDEDSGNIEQVNYQIIATETHLGILLYNINVYNNYRAQREQ